MDQLQEPKFAPDSNWKRFLHGVEPMRKDIDIKIRNLFLILSGLSCYRYLREVTYYKKNYVASLLICSGFVLSSFNIAKFLKEDPFVVAAESNNINETKYKEEYRKLFVEASSKKLELPQSLIE